MSNIGARKKREARALSAAGAAGEPESPLFGRQAPLAHLRRFVPQMQGELTWSQIQSVLTTADRGFCQQWVDLCRRIIETDDHAFSVYETRIDPVAGARRELRPGAAPPGWEAVAERQANDCREMLERLPNVERSFAQLLDADWVGFAVQEIIYEIRGDMVWPVQLEWLNQRRFRWSDSIELYLWDEGQAYQRAKELGLASVDGVGDLGLPLSKGKYVVHVPNIIPNYPMKSGILLAFVRPWYVKNWATKFWLAGAEFAGNPRLIGHITQAAASGTAEDLFNVLSNISADGIGVVREGCEVEITEAKTTSDTVWSALIKICDAAMSKAGVGSTLNVEIGDTGGNRAAAESQGDLTFTPRAVRSARSLANTIEQQLFKPFLELNAHRYGGRVFVPQLTLHTYEEKPTTSDLVAVISGGGRVRHDELREIAGLKPLGPKAGGDAYVTAPGGGFAPVGAPAAAADGEAKVADAALNGAQIDSLQTIITNVATGVLPPESALEIITVAFPTISRETAQRMLSPITPGAAAPPTGAPVAPASIAGDVGAQPSQTDYRAGGAARRPFSLSDAHGDVIAIPEGERDGAVTRIGLPGELTRAAMLDAVPLFEAWRASLMDAAKGGPAALLKWTPDTSAVAAQLYQTRLQANMGGQMFVRLVEVPEVAHVRALDREHAPAFLRLPFDEAIASFRERQLVTPEEFRRMSEEARRRAFTASRLATEELRSRAHSALLDALESGSTLEEFVAQLDSGAIGLGITPSDPAYLELVFRTNTQSAYGAGRFRQLTDPTVVAARPFLEYRTAGDSRVRPRHAALDGVTFAQSDPGWRRFAPPLGFQCRCVMVARAEATSVTESSSIGPDAGPDPGWVGPGG